MDLLLCFTVRVRVSRITGNALEGVGKGHRPDLVVDDGGEMNLLMHGGKKADDLLLKDGTIPDPILTDNVDLEIF